MFTVFSAASLSKYLRLTPHPLICSFLKANTVTTTYRIFELTMNTTANLIRFSLIDADGNSKTAMN